MVLKYVEIALSGDGSTLAIANTKSDRGPENSAVADSTVKIFKFDAISNDWSSTLTVYSGDAGGGGYYFGGLQVSLSDDGSKLVLGLPYVNAIINTSPASGVGNVHVYDLASGSASLTFDLAESLYLGTIIKERAYIGRKVAISGDGTSIIFSAPGDNTVYWSDYGSDVVASFSDGQPNSDVGSSLAISHDGTIFAYGARNHDNATNNAPDKGIVTVQKRSDANEWNRLGKVLMGECGEGYYEGSYYVGDMFGYDLALSEINAYDSDGSTNMICLLVGSPKSDGTGHGDDHYYQGHGELYQIDHVNATPETSWEQIAYDVDGKTSGEKAGTSVAMSTNGDTIIIGAPGYQAAGKGGYFEGTVRVFKQTEYSSVPSFVPSSQPSISIEPSSSPSLSSKPSSIPSASIEPSQSPSISSQSSALPSVSLVPSNLPSSVVDKEFQLISTFGPFGKDTEKKWCLTASETSKLHVRPCRTYDSRSENLQLWKFTESGELKLAGKAIGEFCVKSTFQQIELGSTCEDEDVAMTNFSFEDGSIIQRKHSKIWKLGFDPESRFERVRLYRDGTLNEVLDKWDIRYYYEFPSSQPSVTLSEMAPLQFSLENAHACALLSSEVQCVGYNNHGQIGLPSITQATSTPVTVDFSSVTSSSPKKVVTGWHHTCTLIDDTVFCHGRNTNGQLGNVTPTPYIPVQVLQNGSAIANVKDIEAGPYHNCAILENTSMYCWGWNANGQLGYNSSGTQNIKMLALTYRATCVVLETNLNQVECKGEPNFHGKFYTMGQEIIKITSGDRYVCALLKDTTAKCFGTNYEGQLGNGSNTDSYDEPVNVKVSASDNSPLSNISDINAGRYSTCLIANKVPKCFGWNSNYQLGIANGGATVLYPTETNVNFPNDKEAVSVYVGFYAGHIVYSDNTVFSFGNNFEGTLGDGSIISGTNIIGDQDGENAVPMKFSFPSTKVASTSWRLWSQPSELVEGSDMKSRSWDVSYIQFFPTTDCSGTPIPTSETAIHSGSYDMANLINFNKFGPHNAFSPSNDPWWGGRPDTNDELYVGMTFETSHEIQCVKLDHPWSVNRVNTVWVQAFNANTNTWDTILSKTNLVQTGNVIN